MTRLASWHRHFPGRIAGSVYTAPPGERVSTARRLAATGIDVHVDMMSGDGGLPVGVSGDELLGISAGVARSRLGVQLIGSDAFVDAVLPGVLAASPAKVFLPWSSFTADRAATVRGAGSAAWIVIWDEWDGSGAPSWLVRPDGVLVMLIEPGTAGTARLSQLGVVAACAGDFPVDVDGGVTEDIAPLCITAGVESMVVGRALLGPGPADSTARRAM